MHNNRAETARAKLIKAGATNGELDILFRLSWTPPLDEPESHASKLAERRLRGEAMALAKQFGTAAKSLTKAEEIHPGALRRALGWEQAHTVVPALVEAARVCGVFSKRPEGRQQTPSRQLLAFTIRQMCSRLKQQTGKPMYAEVGRLIGWDAQGVIDLALGSRRKKAGTTRPKKA